nr:hypothetical protein [Kibdelosporangium sp. MJ126-NF4]CTQ94834.1 hypothetical protein [Kibdelosporangium sp. MJ126-NF4]
MSTSDVRPGGGSRGGRGDPGPTAVTVGVRLAHPDRTAPAHG